MTSFNMVTDASEPLTIVDIDKVLALYGVFGPAVSVLEKISEVKTKFLKSHGCTGDCLAAGTEGWPQSALSFFKGLRADPTVRRYGGFVHRLVMEHVFQCKLNPELQQAFETLLNAPNGGKIVFFTNGPRAHAKNVVKMVLGEDLAKKIPIVCSRELGNQERKPDEKAYENLVTHCKEENIIGEISNVNVIDDNPDNLEGAQAAFNNMKIPFQGLRIGRSSPKNAFPIYRTLA